MLVISACYGCGNLFTFHPHKVPSIVVEGTRRPICETCVLAANPIREANGLDPIEILPGAYDGQISEGEL